MFTQEVKDELGNYVYRLIDPRNGETFYVGKGKGNRVFQHALGELAENSEEISDKMRRIREIRLANFEVAHVVHRHGMDNKTAYEVEAALMDAYPNTANISGGHHGSERGAMHANEIIEKFKAETADFKHKMIAITVNKSAAETSLYNAVRFCWKLDRKKAERAEFILAVLRGLIVGVFAPKCWLEATADHFPGFEPLLQDAGRIGFEGEEAPVEIMNLYKGKKIPDSMRKKGAANPVRYINIR